MSPCPSIFLFLYLATMVLALSSAYIWAKFNKRCHLHRQVAGAKLHSFTSPYTFLDCGGYRKLEKFGNVICSRSCPTAHWKPRLGAREWEKALVTHVGSSGKVGKWSGTVPDDWSICFHDNIFFNLNLSELGQIGIFPEQATNWKWLDGRLMGADIGGVDVNILNGFAYTGGSTMAALNAAKRVRVTHLDAAKSSVQWAKQNIEKSQLENEQKRVRWIVDDCITFMNREIKRGSKYDGLIFDPPAFGRFKGKTWKIDRDFPTLIAMIPTLLSKIDTPKFVILSCHDTNFSKERMKIMLEESLINGGMKNGKFEAFDFILKAGADVNNGGTEDSVNRLRGHDLPCGSCVRWIDA